MFLDWFWLLEYLRCHDEDCDLKGGVISIVCGEQTCELGGLAKVLDSRDCDSQIRVTEDT